MSQSVNRGEKSAASEAAADAIKTIVPVEPAETAQDSDAEQPEAQAASEAASAQAVGSDDTPTVDLDDADSDGGECRQRGGHPGRGSLPLRLSSGSARRGCGCSGLG